MIIIIIIIKQSINKKEEEEEEEEEEEIRQTLGDLDICLLNVCATKHTF